MSKTFIRWGNGKNVLIFLHYFGGNANCWKWVADEISAEFTCIAIDMSSFRNRVSFKHHSILNFALITKLIIEKLGIKKYSLIGHSMGGKIALQLAAIDQRIIKNIVLLAPSPPGMEAISIAIRLQLSKKPAIEEANNIINSLTFNPLSKIQLETAINAQLETTESMRKWWVYIGTKQSIINQLSKIKSPILVLCSKSDPAISYNLLETRVMPLLKKSKLIEIKNSGHLYPLESANCVAAWLAKMCN